MNLKLNKAPLKEEYKKKWNIHSDGFLLLCDGNKPISKTLYRKGGINFFDLKKDKYFMLLKHTEAFYDKSILKMSNSKDPKHLKSQWCILNSKGEEKVIFDEFKHGHIIEGSCIYSIDSNYYNIETGEFYGNACTSMKSSKYLYLDLKYNKEREGILIINKLTGESTLTV